jgi:hypothetical protein
MISVNSDQAWPVINQMMMIIGMGIPISHKNTERMDLHLPALHSVIK